MNIYFLVEGRRTEKKFYPKWLKHLVPELIEVNDPFAVDTNNFYVFNGNGFPSILDNHLKNAVADVNTIGKFQYLVMCIDADEVDVAERTDEIYAFIKEKDINLNAATKFVLIVQNRCIETWFLGNRKVYKRNPSEALLRAYTNFYDVSNDDPELMGKLDYFETHAQFHAAYLKEMLHERNIRYSKKKPNSVTEKAYLEELIARTNDTNHITTFHSFVQFCNRIKRTNEMMVIRLDKSTRTSYTLQRYIKKSF